MKDALAIVECIGLPTAIAFADAAVKAAKVTLIGYELSKGAGLVTVKLSGDVGAVKAAAEAGITVAKSITGIAGYIVIPRPSERLEMLIYNGDTVGYTAEEEEVSVDDGEKQCETSTEEAVQEALPVIETMEMEEEPMPEQAEEALPTQPEPVIVEAMPEPTPVTADAETQTVAASCNLCGDPECPRHKGEPRKECIHYSE